MLKVLLRQRLEALGSWITGSTRKNKKQSKSSLIGFAALMVYALISLAFLFWHIFDTVVQPFHTAGMDWLFFSFAAIMSFGLMFVGSVFAAKAQLYEARDNDLMLSLPIPPGDILLSRLFMLFVINLVLDLLVAVPALMVSVQHDILSPLGYLAFVLVFLFLPLLTLAVGALFGWLLSLATSRIPHKSLVTTVLSFAFFGLYMLFSIRMNNMLLSVAANPSGLARSMGLVTPVYWMGIAIAEDSIPALIGASAVMLGAFALMYVILSKTFIRTATGSRNVRKKSDAGKIRTGSADSALFRRELGRFLSCPAYMINAGLGTVMAIAGIPLLLIKGKDILPVLAEIPEITDYLSAIVLGGLCLICSMMLYSTPSVSLEGKTLWIAQSLPVDCRQILRSKLRLHNVMSIPAVVLLSLAAIFLVRPRGILLPCFLILPVLMCLFTGELGLLENLRHPALDWTSETQAVKSGIGVLFTMLISWTVLALPVLVVVFVHGIGISALVTGFTVFIAALCGGMYRLLMTWAPKKYMSL